MIILDTNVWVAFLNQNDTQHKKAKTIFSRLNEQVIIPEYIILETCSVLLIRTNKLIADRFAQMILDNQDIQILPSGNVFLTNVIEQFINSPDKKLSFVDTALLCLSKNHKIITFDKNLEKSIAGHTFRKVS